MKLKPLNCSRIIEVYLPEEDYQLFFLFSPTWQINPEYFPQHLGSDFALGCVDYLQNIEPRHYLVEEYLSGYNAIKELVIKLYRSELSLN